MAYWRDESGCPHSRDWHGLDYADQRWYAASLARFTTSDPFERSAKAEKSGSWNRFAYVENDPKNLYDPQGLVGYCPHGAMPGGGCYQPGVADGQGGGSATGDDMQDGSGGKSDQSDMGGGGPYSDMSIQGRLKDELRATARSIFATGTKCHEVFTAAFGSGPNSGSVSEMLAKIDEVNVHDGTTDRRVLGEIIPGIEIGYRGGTIEDVLADGSYAMAPRMEPGANQQRGRMAGAIIVGNKFYTQSLKNQRGMLVHEMVHVYTGKSDSELGAILGFGTTNQSVVSDRLTDWLLNDCVHDK